jgi:hypothetical protein
MNQTSLNIMKNYPIGMWLETTHNAFFDDEFADKAVGLVKYHIYAHYDLDVPTSRYMKNYIEGAEISGPSMLFNSNKNQVFGNQKWKHWYQRWVPISCLDLFKPLTDQSEITLLQLSLFSAERI